MSKYKIDINGTDSGNNTIALSVKESDAYNQVSKTISITSNIPKPLNDCSWEKISEIAQSGEGDLYFNIGDIKMITLNGKIGNYLTLSNLSLGVYILDFNHPMNGVPDNNIIFGGFKSALTSGIDVALCDSNYNKSVENFKITLNMNHAGQSTNPANSGYFGTNNGGWKGTDFRYDILGATSTAPSMYKSYKTSSNIGYDATEYTLENPKANTLLAALPADFRNVLRLWTRYVDVIGKSDVDESIQPTVDAITLLAESEIVNIGTHGSNSWANQYEFDHNTRMAYYAEGNSTVKYNHSATANVISWWLISSSYFTVQIERITPNGNIGYAPATYSQGIAPAFKV